MKPEISARDFRGALAAVKAVDGAKFDKEAKAWELPQGWSSVWGVQPNTIGDIVNNVRCGDLIIVEGCEAIPANALHNREAMILGEAPAPVAVIEVAATTSGTTETVAVPVVETLAAYSAKLAELWQEAGSADAEAAATRERYHRHGDIDGGYRAAARHEARAEKATTLRAALRAAYPDFDKARQVALRAAEAAQKIETTQWAAYN